MTVGIGHDPGLYIDLNIDLRFAVARCDNKIKMKSGRRENRVSATIRFRKLISVQTTIDST